MCYLSNSDLYELIGLRAPETDTVIGRVLYINTHYYYYYHY